MTSSRREEFASRGRLAARGVLKRLQVRSVDEIDLPAIAHVHGLKIKHGGMTGARGRLTRGAEGGIIRIADQVTNEAQQRFVVAHELGHYFMHGKAVGLSLCTDGDLVEYAVGSAETEANIFAAELLMPRILFERHCDVATPSLDHVRELSKAFNTTLTATAIRFVDLCPEPCATVWCEKGIVRWCVRGPEFFPWIARARRLDNRSHAHDAFAGIAIPKSPDPVSIQAWAEDGTGDVMEHTLFFHRLQASLTLLWLRD